MEIARGQIWLVNFNPAKNREIGKIRPALVFQADWLMQDDPRTIMVMPLSTQGLDQAEPWNPVLPPRERILRPSRVAVHQIRALDRGRFLEGPLASLQPHEVVRIEEAFALAAGMLHN